MDSPIKNQRLISLEFDRIQSQQMSCPLWYQEECEKALSLLFSLTAVQLIHSVILGSGMQNHDSTIPCITQAHDGSVLSVHFTCFGIITF